MKTLLVFATKEEAGQLLNKGKTDVLITGPGMVSTVYHLSKQLQKKKYDLVINAGICGSFSNKLRLGDVVNVAEECFSDLGSENGNDFIHLSEMGFNGEDDFPLRKKFLKNKSAINSKTLSSLPKAKGITVSTVHGNKKSIERVKKLFNPDVESMEGAAVFYLCGKEKIPFVGIRAVSNYVEKRDKSKWKIPLAINNLYAVLKNIMNEIK